MKNFVRLALFPVVLACAGACPALADSYTFTLTPPSAIVAAGEIYTFTGVISATAGNDADLSLISETVNGDDPLTFKSDPFYSDTPISLSGGETYAGDLFTVTLPATTPAGLYNGAVSVNLEDSAGNALFKTLPFTVNATTAVASTPEPGSWLLLGTGLLGAGLVRRRWLPVQG